MLMTIGRWIQGLSSFGSKFWLLTILMNSKVLTMTEDPIDR
jgi:hypothetical protein